MRSTLMKFYWRMERAFYPELRYSQWHYHQTLNRTIPQGCEWLDLGCGHQMFASWMTVEERDLAMRSRRLIGIDLDWEALKGNKFASATVFGNLESLPFRSISFDIATANMVVEHLTDPDAVLREVRRVLKPGGLFILHTPNLRSVVIGLASRMPQFLKNALALILEGRKEADVFPTHYRMNTLAMIRQRAEVNGFHVQELRSVCSSAITALFGPLSIIELLYLRALAAGSMEGRRSNLICVLRKC